MVNVPLLGSADRGGDAMPVSQYTPKESIWKRPGISNGRSIRILRNHRRQLETKVKASHERDNLAYRRTIVMTTTALGLIGNVVNNTSYSWPTCDHEDIYLCTIVKVGLAASSLLLVPLTMYARHRYQLQNSKCSLWKEKIRLIGIFYERIGYSDQMVPGDTLRELLSAPMIPSKLKQKMAVKASFNQYFEVASGLSEDEVKEILYPLMHPDDQASLHFLLNPSEHKIEDVLICLSQFRLFFANHPEILIDFVDRLSSSYIEKDEVKQLILEIEILRERQGAAAHECSLKIEPLISKKVSVRVGSEVVEVSRRKLCKYPRFSVYIPEKIDGDAANEGGALNIASVVEDDQGNARLDLPLLPDQDGALVLVILKFIDTGRLSEDVQDIIALIKTAEYYGVRPLVEACIKEILEEMDARGLMKEQKADIFRRVSKYFPEGPLPEALKSGVGKEYRSAINSASIEDVRFWLNFTKEIAPDQLFHRFIYLPKGVTAEMVDLIFELRPKILLTTLIGQLKADCRDSSNPMEFMERFSTNEELYLQLADVILDFSGKRYIVSVWDFACRKRSVPLKAKVAQRLRLEPTLTEHWPFRGFPDELKTCI